MTHKAPIVSLSVTSTSLLKFQQPLHLMQKASFSDPFSAFIPNRTVSLASLFLPAEKRARKSSRQGRACVVGQRRWTSRAIPSAISNRPASRSVSTAIFPIAASFPRRQARVKSWRNASSSLALISNRNRAPKTSVRAFNFL